MSKVEVLSIFFLISSFYFVSTSAGKKGFLGLFKGKSNHHSYTYAEDEGTEYGDEETNRSDAGDSGGFNLEEDKSKIEKMICEIEKYLSGVISIREIEAAENVVDLISAANDSLSTEQYEELLKKPSSKLIDLREQLIALKNDFKADMVEAGIVNSDPPFTGLCYKLRKAIKRNKHVKEEENDYIVRPPYIAEGDIIGGNTFGSSSIGRIPGYHY